MGTSQLPTTVYGRKRTYLRYYPQQFKRYMKHDVTCKCEWTGVYGQCVAYRDDLGLALACPSCGSDLMA